jgi:hypothetical protein
MTDCNLPASQLHCHQATDDRLTRLTADFDARIHLKVQKQNLRRWRQTSVRRFLSSSTEAEGHHHHHLLPNHQLLNHQLRNHRQLNHVKPVL